MMIREGITIPFLFIFSIFFPYHLGANNTVLIAGYLTPAPLSVVQEVVDTRTSLPKVGGIKMMYSGYHNFSNGDGYFSFPKHHAAHELRIVITSQTGYDLLKHTVSHQKLPKDMPPIAVYKVQKIKESVQTIERKPMSMNAHIDSEQWMWKVKHVGNTAPRGGLTSHDLIIICDPKHIYLQDGSTHYAEESSQFVLPHNLMYVVSTPQSSELKKGDEYTQSVDAEKETDVAKNGDAPPTEREISQAATV